MGWLDQQAQRGYSNDFNNSRYKKTIAGAVCNHTVATFLLASRAQKQQLYSADLASVSLINHTSIRFKMITKYWT
nr:hypothetical protein [uncultured Pseudomonas sp.]